MTIQNIYKSSILVALISSSSSCLADSSPTHPTKSGRFFASLGLLTNWYEYENNQVRADLPASFNPFLDANDLTGSESDIANGNYAIGYYFSNDFSVRLNYSDGIELDYLNNILSSQRFDIEMELIEIDAKYDFLSLSDQVAVYAVAGIVSHQVDAVVYRTNDGERENLLAEKITETDTKLGLGLQWDFSDSWGIKFGYSHLNYMSIDKRYINFEYRF